SGRPGRAPRRLQPRQRVQGVESCSGRFDTMDAAVRGASTPDLAPSIAAKLGKLIGRARAKPGTAESAGHGKPALKARRASRPDPGWTGPAGPGNTSHRRSPTLASKRIIPAARHLKPPED